MLSTIPNVKRAEISSSSAKPTSQTRSQHSTINVSEANKTLNASIECLATSYPNDTEHTTKLGGISEDRQETSIANEVQKPIEDNFNFENCASGKAIEVARNTNNERNSCSATNSSSNLSDMSRRKQRNPKPTLFASFEDNEYNKNPENMQVLKNQNDEMYASDRTDIDVSDYDKNNDDENVVSTNIKNVGAIGDNNEGKGSSTYSSPRSSSSPTPPPHDLSSMVKVEVHEGTTEIRAPHILSPLGKEKEVRSSLGQAQHQNLLHHSSASRLGSSSLPTLTPMPTQQRPLLMSNPPLIIPPGAVPESQIPPGACTSLGTPLHLSKMMMNSEMTGNVGMSKDDINMVSKQNNMFHFGDVSVAHHPDTAPVPMIIPMVYLYPLAPSIDKTGNITEPFLRLLY